MRTARPSARAGCREPASMVGAAIAMKKERLTLKLLGMGLLCGAAVWPAGVRAADPAPAPAAAASSSSAPSADPTPPPGGHLVPGQLSAQFKIYDDDPEASVPTPQQRIGNPLEFGYYLQ